MKRIVPTIIFVIAALLMLSTIAYANNEATQNASTSSATSISIKAQDYTTDVSTITFPAGVPGATISNPSNDHPDNQTLGGAGTAKPVVTLLNSGGATYTIWYQITTFTNSVVANEFYLVNNKGAACADAATISNAVTFVTLTSTGVTINSGVGNEKDLYLKVTLGSAAGKSGTSTITILGES